LSALLARFRLLKVGLLQPRIMFVYLNDLVALVDVHAVIVIAFLLYDQLHLERITRSNVMLWLKKSS